MATSAPELSPPVSDDRGGFLQTAIGSVPHAQLDAALEFAFAFDVPFLPQMPRRSPREFMLAQALSGFPGLRVDADGGVSVDGPEFDRGYPAARAAVDRALDGDPGTLARFEPELDGPWGPFLWEARERGRRRVKVQLAGPVTARWALQSSADGAPFQDLAFRWIWARAAAMAHRLREEGLDAVFLLDEPGLIAWTRDNPLHRLALRELGLLLTALRKAGVSPGLHCCGNTDWSSLLALPIDWLSIDTQVSLATLLAPEHAEARQAFAARGGRLILGIVPSPSHSEAWRGFEAGRVAREVLDQLRAAGEARLARTAWLSPACGLALHDVGQAQEALDRLRGARGALRDARV